MKTSKLLIGSGYKRGKLVWMEGTPDEVVRKLSEKFKLYTERPLKKNLEKAAA